MSAQEVISANIAGQAAESGRAMGSGMKGKGGADEQGATELYKVNQVWYRLPPTLSLVSKRTLLVNQSQRQTYTNPYTDVITFIFNTGEFYTSMQSSYLYIEIGYNTPNGTYNTDKTSNTPLITFTTSGTTNSTASSPVGSYQFAKALISQGNALSLFEEVVFLSASGTEICREQNKGLESSVRFRYEHDQQYIDTIGQVQGAAYGPYQRNYDGVTPVFDSSLGGNLSLNSQAINPIGGWETLVQPRSGNGSEAYFHQGVRNINNTKPQASSTQYVGFCIPMDQVLGCFKPYMSTLFPAGALAGGRLEMRLKNPIEALQFIAGCVENKNTNPDPGNPYLANLLLANQTGLVINKAYMVMDCFQLQDNVLKRLNEVSAGQDGLSLLFDTYDHTSVLANGAGTVEAQVQQARSRIIRSYCVVRDTANLQNPYINSLCSESPIQRVSGVDTPGYFNINATSNAITSANNTGFDGSFTVLTYPTALTTGGGGTWAPLTVVGSSGGSVTSTPYPFIEKGRLIDSPFSSSTSSGGYQIVTSYQAQLGSLFFPQQPLTTIPEFYQNAQYIWCKGVPDPCNVCSVSLQDFIGGLGWALYDPNATTWSPAQGSTAVDPTKNGSFGKWCAPYGLSIYGMLAEKSQALQLSGLPISNARLMRHKFTFAYNPMSQTSRTINVFTQYTRVMKVFLGGRVVVRE